MTVIALVAGLVVVISPTTAGRADALTRHTAHRVVHIAASRKGDKYKWGAEGSGRYDCSGLTLWVFARVGKHLPGCRGTSTAPPGTSTGATGARGTWCSSTTGPGTTTARAASTTSGSTPGTA